MTAGRSPFLLPCAVTAFLGVLTTVLNVFTMDETLPSRARGGIGQRYKLLTSDEEAAAAGQPAAAEAAQEPAPTEATLPLPIRPSSAQVGVAAERCACGCRRRGGGCRPAGR